MDCNCCSWSSPASPTRHKSLEVCNDTRQVAIDTARCAAEGQYLRRADVVVQRLQPIFSVTSLRRRGLRDRLCLDRSVPVHPAVALRQGGVQAGELSLEERGNGRLVLSDSRRRRVQEDN